VFFLLSNVYWKLTVDRTAQIKGALTLHYKLINKSNVKPTTYYIGCVFHRLYLKETSTYSIDKNLSDKFPIHNGLKQGDDLSPLLFNSALEYAIRRVQENQKGLTFNGTKQLLAYADDVNIVGNNMDTTQKNTKVLLDASKNAGLKVNPEKTTYQKAGQKPSIQIANRSFEDVAKFKYLGTTLTDKNCMHEEIKSSLNSGNACHHSVQRLLSSRLLSRNVKVKIYKTIILPVVLHGCETWYFTLSEDHRLRVSENRVLRRIFERKWDEVTGEWGSCTMGSFINCVLPQISLGRSSHGG
jgi:hypothetical protein